MPRSSKTQPSKPRSSESRPRQNNQAKQSKLSPEAKKEAITQAHAWLRTPEGRHASNGKPNFMAAHKKFGIPYNTLRDRVLGLHRAPHEAHAAQMLITPEQEQAMVDWMKKDAEEGHPWTRVRIKLRVSDLTGGRIPSNSWIYSFNDRHHDILHFRSTSGLDPVRAQCFNPTTIHEHFKKYGEIQGNYRIKVNFDETGNQLGGGRKNTGRKCYTVRGASSTKYRQRDASLELVTVMEACTSEGVMLDPGFIFSSSSGGWTTEWWEGFEDRPISVGLTNNGWTSDDQCIYWFENVFLPQVQQMRENPDERVLCIFDGHHSHLTDDYDSRSPISRAVRSLEPQTKYGK